MISTDRVNRTALLTFTLFAGAVTLAGIAFAPARVAAAALLSGYYLAGIGLGAMFLLAVQDVSGGTWANRFRDPARMLAALIQPGSLLLLLAVSLGGRHLYPWLVERGESGSFKDIWLRPDFFFARSLLYVALWLLFFRLFLNREARIRERRRRRVGLAVPAAYLVVFAFTVWLSSVDWIMSLEPHWTSTVFGVYHFSGLFATAIAAAIVVSIHLRRRGKLEIETGQLHDLGKMLFAFSTFWAYIWFSQAMLIWYGNVPDEATYYIARLTGVWRIVFVANVVLNWVVPFLALMSRAGKVNEKVLLRVSIAVLIGHWVDLYLAVYPPVFRGASELGGWELALALGCFAIAGLFVTWGSEAREATASSF